MHALFINRETPGLYFESIAIPYIMYNVLEVKVDLLFKVMHSKQHKKWMIKQQYIRLHVSERFIGMYNGYGFC